MQITRCLHTAILVSDLAKAEHFYGTVLGLPKVERTLRFPGVWYQLGEYQIHVIVDAAFQSNLQNPDKWGRNGHLALSVTDLQAAEDELIAQGYPIQKSASGRPALFTQDPDGNVIEISSSA